MKLSGMSLVTVQYRIKKGGERREREKSKVPAHLVEEAVGFCHSVELMFVLLQKIHIALLWDKLQQLMGQKRLFTYL